MRAIAKLLRNIFGASILLALVTLPTFAAPPAHDAFADPAELSGEILAWSHTLAGATVEPGEENLFYETSVWARWTAPISAEFKVTVPFDSTPDVSVFRGNSLSNLQKVNTYVQFGSIFSAEAGTTYFFRVAAPINSVDSFVLRLAPVPPNSSPETALELTGNEASASSQNWTWANHYLSLAEQPPLWFKWTAPAHGNLTFLSDTNSLRAAISIYHQKRPTLDSNVFEPYSLARRTPPQSGNMVVTAGVTYRFAMRSLPTTNLALSLRFQPALLNLESPNILFGGVTLPSLDTTTYHSAPDAFQFAGIPRAKHAWFEMVFRGPGTLSFRTKVASFESAAIRFTGTNWSQSITLNTSREEWMLHTFNLPRATNITRWTILNFADASSPITAWFDDITFTPIAAAEPLLSISASNTQAPALNLPLEAYRTTVVEISTNLTTWTAWTNFFTSTNTIRSLQLPKNTNQPAVFYRAHVRD